MDFSRAHLGNGQRQEIEDQNTKAHPRTPGYLGGVGSAGILDGDLLFVLYLLPVAVPEMGCANNQRMSHILTHNEPYPLFARAHTASPLAR